MSRPLVSALASAFLRRPRRNSADLTGQRALETPNCLPVVAPAQLVPRFDLGPSLVFQGSLAASQLQSLQFLNQASLTLRAATSAASVPPHGDGLDLLGDILEVLGGTVELPAVDGLGGLAGVLEGDTEVGATSASALRGVDVGGSVADLEIKSLRQPLCARMGRRSDASRARKKLAALSMQRYARAGNAHHRGGRVSIGPVGLSGWLVVSLGRGEVGRCCDFCPADRGRAWAKHSLRLARRAGAAAPSRTFSIRQVDHRDHSTSDCCSLAPRPRAFSTRVYSFPIKKWHLPPEAVVVALPAVEPVEVAVLRVEVVAAVLEVRILPLVEFPRLFCTLSIFVDGSPS